MPNFKNEIIESECGIHCDTENKAIALLKWGHSKGLKWGSRSYLDKEHNWNRHKSNTIYYLSLGTFGSKPNAMKKTRKIYTYEEALEK